MSDGSASDASRASRRFAHGKHSQAGVPELLTSSASSAPLPRFRPLAQLLRAELDVLYAVQRTRRMLPHALRWLCDRLISSHPFYDVSIAVWMTTPFALAAYGWVLWWLLVLNVAVAFSLHWALDAPSPADLDARLRPRARLSPSGFPCMEVQLATALLAYIAWWHASALVWCGCALAVGALVLLRVYALTHFPHQLALSVALGGFSVPAGRAVARYFFKARLHPQMHGLGVVFVMFIVAGFVAYHAETNSVPFMRIPRSECARGALPHAAPRRPTSLTPTVRPPLILSAQMCACSTTLFRALSQCLSFACGGGVAQRGRAACLRLWRLAAGAGRFHPRGRSGMLPSDPRRRDGSTAAAHPPSLPLVRRTRLHRRRRLSGPHARRATRSTTYFDRGRKGE